MGDAYYHHPADRQFSLDYVHQDPDRLLSRIAEYEDDVSVKLIEYDFEESFYAVYTSQDGGKPVRELEFDLSSELDDIDSPNRAIVLRIFELYQSLITENEEQEGTTVEAYKDIEFADLPEALDRISWDGSATDVAGRLASNVILKHALPNANHRTAIALIQLYLRQIEPEFSMPETATETDSGTYDWRDWVNEYINESKRLLTVRRNNVLFKHMSRFGTETVQRKHGVEIDLSEYSLDMYPREAREQYAEKHEQHWIKFVEEAVERTGNPELVETEGILKTTFSERLSGQKSGGD